MTNNQKRIQRWWRLSIVILLAIGICFRFTNLDKKAYWRDEVATSLRVSGYTTSEVIQQVYDGRIIGVQDLEKYQRPNSDKGLKDTIKSLAVEDSQHPPLYYVMVRFWAQWFGNSPGTMRTLSAFISLLTFPSFYWLCIELFESALVGWGAIALTSVSLFHLMYAQEAREYGLWTVTILLASAALLRAIKRQKKVDWGIYAATLTLGFYTFPLTGLVWLGQGIYVAVIERFRLTKNLVSYFLASLLVLLAFTLWLFVVITNSSKIISTTGWLFQPVSWRLVVQHWLLNISYVFVSASPKIMFFVFVLIIYSFYFLCRKNPYEIWLFVLLLIGSTAIPLILSDVINGGRLSATTRYMVPCFLGIQIAVAYCFTTGIVLTYSQKRWLKILWTILMIAVILVGIWTCSRFLKTENGWNKGNFNNLPMARIINKSKSPLVISEVKDVNDLPSLSNFISLTYMLVPKVKFQLVVQPNIPKIPDGFNDIFLFKPSRQLQKSFQQEQKYKSQEVDRRLKRTLLYFSRENNF